MPAVELERLREVATNAVRAGMEVVRSRRGEEEEDVTAVEHAAEAAAIGVLREGDPDTPFVGEMSGGEARVERAWVVDPVDGTANLLRGDPFVAVTVALLVDGRPVIGAIGCPFTGELWSAAQGAGAHDASGRRLELVERPAGGRRIALDPAETGPRDLGTWNEVRARLTEAFGEVELRSAIALELAYVAAGTFDGLVQVGGSPVQDFAAGVLLIGEAGGLVTGLDGRPDVWRSDIVVAGTPGVYRDLCTVLEGLGKPPSSSV